MNKIIKYIAVLLFFFQVISCAKDKLIDNHPELVGTWRLFEICEGVGGAGNFTPGGLCSNNADFQSSPYIMFKENGSIEFSIIQPEFREEHGEIQKGRVKTKEVNEEVQFNLVIQIKSNSLKKVKTYSMKGVSNENDTLRLTDLDCTNCYRTIYIKESN